MTTIAASPLSDVLQRLVDARLDTIDRMLLGRVNRQDRLAIVREVEAQIHDLLQDRDPGSLDREDVLAILARLDPPEAYLPEESAESSPTHRPASIPRAESRVRGSRSRVSLVSGIVGLASVGMAFASVATFLLAGTLNDEVLLVGTFGSIGLTFLLGLVATALAAYVRLRGAWSVVGLMTGIFSTMAALVGGIALLLAL